MKEKETEYTVSCIIATYNRLEMVSGAILSVLKEMIDKLEIIIVDDGSEDDTFKKLKMEYDGNVKVRVFRFKKNRGVSSARNYGILKARGKYITFLDDDDINLVGRIKSQLEMAIKHNLDFVTCTRFLYDSGNGLYERGIKTNRLTLERLWKRNEIVNVTPLVESELMRKVMFDTSLPAANDYDAWVRCLQLSKRSANYSKPCICHRRDVGASITKNRKKKVIGRTLFYIKHGKKMSTYYRIRFVVVTMAKLIVPDPKYFIFRTLDRFKIHDKTIEK